MAHDWPMTRIHSGFTGTVARVGGAGATVEAGARWIRSDRERPVTLFYSFVPHDATNPVLLANYLRGKLGTNAGAL